VRHVLREHELPFNQLYRNRPTVVSEPQMVLAKSAGMVGQNGAGV
jgi:hypothetical protein